MPDVIAPIDPTTCALLVGTYVEASERDDTRDWLLEPQQQPPTFAGLVEQVEEALQVARSSEAAVESIGIAATEAAERARDAVEQAADAAEHARRSAELAGGAGFATAGGRRESIAGRRPLDDPSLNRFSDRADRLVARLRALQRIPLRSSAKSTPLGR